MMRPDRTYTTVSAGPLLTEAEHRAMDLSADLWNLLCQIVGSDAQVRCPDLTELAVHVHAIQNAVLAQAAARAYPSKYRMMGLRFGFQTPDTFPASKA